MANTIIAKFQAEGLGQFTSEVNNASTQMEMFDKAQKIVNQTTSDLTKKQLELREAISRQAGIMNALKDRGEEQGKLYQDLKLKLDANIKSFEAETAAIKKGVSEKKKLILEEGNYKKILDQVANGEVSAREASKTLRQELIKLGLQGKQNTKEYKELKNVAGELADTIGDASAEISQAGSDTRGLDKALRVATTVTAGFGLVEGATALFGKENENLQKTLLKVNGVMLIMNSLQQIQEELKKKDTLFTGLQTAAQRVYAVAVGQSTGALKLLRVAMLGSGIGAVIAGLYLLVTNWQKIKDAVTGTTDAMRENARISKLNADTRREAADSIKGEVANIYELVAVAKNENFTRADRQHAIDELQSKYPEYLKNISLETIGTDATSEAIKAQIKLLTQREQIKKLADKRAELSNKLLDNEAIDQQFSAKEKVKIFLAKALSGKNEDGSRDDEGNPDLQNVLTTARSRVKKEIQKQIDDIDALVDQVLGKIGKSNKSVFSEDFVKKATKEKSKVVLNELEKLKAELQKKQKELETEVSKLVVKEGKTESKLSIDLRAKITGIEEQIRVIDNLIKNEPLKIEADIIFTQIESQLQEAITSLENKIKEIFAEDVFLGNNPKENEQIKLLITQLDEAKAKFEQFKADYDALFKEDEGVQLPNLFENIDAESFVNSISDITSIGKDGYKKYYDYIQSLREQGLISEQTASDAIQALQQQRLATIEANAQKAQTIYGEIFNVVSQGTQLASQIIAQNAQKEISALDEKKNKGLISEKQYNKEVAKVKNEEAQKQRKVDIAMAAAKVPMVALEAFIGSIKYGLIAAGIITGLATAFATAQVVAIAKAPLPKFRHGGLVVGNKHEQGGVPAELEGNEFVLKREAVSKYGTKALDKINNGLLNPNVFNMPLLPVNMIYGNHTRNLDRSSEQIKNLQYKLSEKLEYIYQGIENGNQDRYMLAKKSNKILKQLKNSNKYG